MRLVQLSRESLHFPPPEMALREPNGLLAMGGDLSPARLLNAYQRGIFPGFHLAIPFCGGRPIRVPFCCLNIFISAAA